MIKINSDQIQAAINSPSSNAHDLQTKSANERAKQERVMDRLWARLMEIYGHQLNSQFGPTIPESWERLLTGISPDQLKHGLDSLAGRSETWPPNAVEFRSLCLPQTVSPDGKNSKAYLSFSDPAHPDYEPVKIENLTQKQKRVEKARSELSNLKELFA